MTSVVKFLGGGIMAVIALIIVIIAIGYFLWNRSMNKEIGLVLDGANGDQKIVTEEMLKGLPEPVKRYMKYTGVVGKQIPKTVYLEQKGRIRNDNDSPWMEFEAYQYYSTKQPNFVWRVFLPSFSMPITMGRDHYLDGKGSIFIKLLSLIPMAKEEGLEMDVGAQMRFFNEMMWFPMAFLGENVSWKAIDNNSAEATFTDRGTKATAVLYFDNEGKIVDFVAERFIRTKDKPVMATWSVPMIKYGEYEGLKLPSVGYAVYKLKEGDLKYIEVEITKIKYD